MTYHDVFIYSPVYVHLVCFHFLTNLNKAAIAFLKTTLLRYNLHIVKVIHLKYIIEWVLIDLVLQSLHNLILEYVHHPQKKPVSITSHFHMPSALPYFSPRQSLIYILSL